MYAWFSIISISKNIFISIGEFGGGGGGKGERGGEGEEYLMVGGGGGGRIIGGGHGEDAFEEGEGLSKVYEGLFCFVLFCFCFIFILFFLVLFFFIDFSFFLYFFYSPFVQLFYFIHPLPLPPPISPSRFSSLLLELQFYSLLEE